MSDVAPVREQNKSAENPLSDRSRFAGTEYALNRALRGPDRDLDRAVEIAARFWGIGRRIPVGYSPSQSDAAGTNFWPDTGALTIELGPTGASSARVLLSTMYHERIHIAQARAGNWSARSRRWAVAVNELEAYDAELAISKRLGLSAEETSVVQDFRSQYYEEVRGTQYQPNVDRGDYRIDPEDLIR